MIRCLSIILLSCIGCFGATTTSISRFGITLTFSGAVTNGTYIAGDDWFQLPVTINSQSPAWSGTNNGAEINPLFVVQQGFASHIPNYDAAKRVTYPLTITTNCSLVVTIGSGLSAGTASAIQTAVVFTFVTEPPATNAFRPPYIGIDKPSYLVTDIDQSVIKSYSSTGVSNKSSLATTLTNFNRSLMMDHHPNDARRYRPRDVLADYNPENGPLFFNGLLSVNMDDTYVQKLPALIQFAQYCIDRAHVIYAGYRASGTGHNPNQRIFAAFGAYLLNMTAIKTYLTTATDFHEDIYIVYGTNCTPGRPLWGQLYASAEFQYWNFIMNDAGAQSHRDPYMFVDGGKGGDPSNYQVITSQGLKGTALAGRLIPELQAAFPAYNWTNVNNYAERWVTNGYWFAQDPAAPYDGTPSNYGITFGPNGSGGWITGAGRFPLIHGTGADSGQYSSSFVRNMWNVYAPVINLPLILNQAPAKPIRLFKR